jgi:hypothetical protein
MLPTPLYFSPLHHQHHFSLLGVYFRLEAKSSQSASEVEKIKKKFINQSSFA